jgi:hypothetical protein
MAIIDKRLEIADAVSIAAAAGTALRGDQIDLGVARDVGNGEPEYLVITVDTAIVTAGSAGTVQFILASDAQAAIATDNSATVHWVSKAFATGGTASAPLRAGDVIAVLALPSDGGQPYERFLGLLVVTGTTTTTAGAISATITRDPTGQSKSYADALS